MLGQVLDNCLVVAAAPHEFVTAHRASNLQRDELVVRPPVRPEDLERSRGPPQVVRTFRIADAGIVSRNAVTRNGPPKDRAPAKQIGLGC